MIKGIIFDFDGTILDSVEARISAWKAALADYGADVGEDDIRRDIGIPGSVLAGKYVKNTYEVEMLQERYFMNRIDSMHLFPDVADTFNILRKRGVKIAVVTSTRRIVMDHFTLNADIIVTIDDGNIRTWSAEGTDYGCWRYRERSCSSKETGLRIRACKAWEESINPICRPCYR